MDIHVLGPLEAVHKGARASLGGPRQRAVLAMLALGLPDTVSTDRIVDGIWGDAPPAKPLSTLQVFVHNLRKALAAIDPVSGRDVIESRSPGYLLTAATSDLGTLAAAQSAARDHAAAGRSKGALVELQRALALWRGPALDDLRSLPFADPHVARLDETRLTLEEDALDAGLRLGDHQELVPRLEERVRTHPTRERLWGQLMVALYRCERQADALATYARAREILARELGIDPGSALAQLELSILRQDPELAAPTIGQAADSVDIAPRPKARIPRPPTATVGRAADVAALSDLLEDDETPLVTVTGVGGTGKTRVATVVARKVVDRFPGGVWFVPLADEGGDVRLLDVLARVVAGSESQDPAAAVAESLAPGRGLVVLDNLEHVRDAPGALRDLAVDVPALTVLATSRRALRIAGEREYPLRPLELPATKAAPGEIAAAPAAQLFATRARAWQPDFAVDVDNAQHVATVCRLVDGIPLALELAAARVRLMPLPRMIERLAASLDLLVSTASDLPARHRTLASTVAWSLEQVSADARSVCGQLTVFEGGFTLDAAEAVCTASGTATLDALTELIDARLAQNIPSRVQVRFALLGTVRTHVRAEIGDAVADHHARLAAWLTGRVREWAADLDGPDSDIAIARFEDEFGDLDTVLEAVRKTNYSAAVELALGTTPFWVASGRLVQGEHHLAVLLEGSQHTDPSRAALLAAAGRLAYHRTDWSAARAYCRQALDIAVATAPGDTAARLVAATARCYLAGALAVSGASDEAAGEAEVALAEAVALDDYGLRVVSLSVLAIAAAVAGDFDTERSRYEQRLELVRARGDRARIADTLNTLAEIALDEADAGSASALSLEALQLSSARLPLEHRDALITVSRADLESGRPAAAADRLRDALSLSERTGQVLGTAQCWRVAACLVRGEDPALAVRWFAAAQRLQPVPTGTDVPPERDLAEALAAARASLSPQVAEREWLLGSSLPVESLRDAVNGVLERLAATAPPSG